VAFGGIAGNNSGSQPQSPRGLVLFSPLGERGFLPSREGTFELFLDCLTDEFVQAESLNLTGILKGDTQKREDTDPFSKSHEIFF